MEHDWQPDIRNGNPVFVCTDFRCVIVWWPDRPKPNSECPVYAKPLSLHKRNKEKD